VNLGRLQVVALALTLCWLPLGTAAEWRSIAQDENRLVSFYLDAGTIRYENGLVRVLLLYEFAHPQLDHEHHKLSRSLTALVWVDCADGRIGIGEMKRYADSMGRGPIVEQSALDAEVRFAKTAPGTLNRRVVESVCSSAPKTP
jgi:hypothetical protein